MTRCLGIFQLAEHLSVPLNTVLFDTTHRQFKSWMHRLEQRWNEPTITEHYLMQVAAEIRRTRMKNPGRVKLDDLKIPFTKVDELGKPIPKAPPTKKELESASKASKTRWAARLGERAKNMTPVKRQKPKKSDQ